MVEVVIGGAIASWSPGWAAIFTSSRPVCGIVFLSLKPSCLTLQSHMAPAHGLHAEICGATVHGPVNKIHERTNRLSLPGEILHVVSHKILKLCPGPELGASNVLSCAAGDEGYPPGLSSILRHRPTPAFAQPDVFVHAARRRAPWLLVAGNRPRPRAIRMFPRGWPPWLTDELLC